MQIIKRNGKVQHFDEKKIRVAIEKAFDSTNDIETKAYIAKCFKSRESCIQTVLNDVLTIVYQKEEATVEKVQDIVELTLQKNKLYSIAKNFMLYRERHKDIRTGESSLMKAFDEIIMSSSEDSDEKRSNANINGDTSMGAMLQIGSSAMTECSLNGLISKEYSELHTNGDIHIHDLDFYPLTTTCCQIDLTKLFKNGFSTGHGFLREPNSIASYSALACIAIQSNQNDQHGGQSIPMFDYDMANGVRKSYKKIFTKRLIELYEDYFEVSFEEAEDYINTAVSKMNESFDYPTMDSSFDEIFNKVAKGNKIFAEIISKTRKRADKDITKMTYQAMESFIHNLNTMHSRAGAQVPFSSINYGTDTSIEGRLVIEQLLLANEAGLGNGETPIFPIHIFKVKEGVNYNPSDANYDLFKLACRVSAKRLFPNFSFIDAPYNLQYYKEGKPETEIAYMGCRTRVMGNVYDEENQIVTGRGNLSFTSINLPRLAILSNKSEVEFYNRLTKILDDVVGQLLERFNVQAHRKVRNYPFLMGQKVWLDSDNLDFNDEVKEVLKHGTLSIGFIGLAETLISLYGQHHGESNIIQQKGLEIVKFMRKYLDDIAQKTRLNFSLLATPAEGLSGRFVRMDKKKFGEIPGVTDKEYYTNSFHVPVYYPISVFEKIKLEAPYHSLTNAGHISYVELDGDPLNNLSAFEKVIRCMKDAGIGYGSINHPVDYDPVCGYTGIIGETCPKCGRKEGNIKFDRIRRITGYLVGTLDRFNDAKLAEVRDRVKHNV